MTAASRPASDGTNQDDQDLTRFGYHQQLRRSLSFTDLMVYGLIFMVPIAPFGIFGGVFAASGGMVALAYLIGMTGMAFTALSYSQMSRAFPLAGSVYTYAGRGIAPAVGFVAGWQILLDYVLVPSLLYLVAGVAMHSFVPAVPVWLWVAGFVAINTTVNYLGIGLTARINRLVLVAELVVLVIFLVVGMVALARGHGGHFSLRPVYDAHTFSPGLVFGAVSVAVLSFLGFDGISTLAEENRDGGRQVGRAMVAALGLAGTLFVVQSWVAALLVPDRQALLANGDPTGTAFYDAAEVAGGHWLNVLTAVATAISWGFANAMVAQAATSRLLFSMARDRQLPRLLARVHPVHLVPAHATVLVAAVSLAIGVAMSGRAGTGVATLSSLVNFGALSAFLLLHVSVFVHHVVRQGSRDWLRHVVVPLAGVVILGYVLVRAQAAAQTVGLSWLAIGLVVLVALFVTGHRPRLAGLDPAGDGPTPSATGGPEPR